MDLLIRARQAVVDGRTIAAAIGVDAGRIVRIEPLDDVDAPPSATRVIELADDELLLPGLVDTHVHVNEPGRTEWEGFASATRAAAAGGITTIIDMPLNSIPATCDPDALAVKRRAASPVSVDVGFWGGVIPANLGSLRELHKAGVWGFKCFLLESGVAEFPPLDYGQLDSAMREIAGFGGLLIIHAEDAETIASATQPQGRSYAGFLGSRPVAAEVRAIDAVIAAVRRTGCRTHIVHLSAAAAVPALAAAQADGWPITAESCPHYLSLAADGVPDGATQFKCCPPIRDTANRDALWDALAAGTISAIVSDHSPCTAELKQLAAGDFGTAWGGIASLQLGASVVWTAARERGYDPSVLAAWMAAGPADLIGLASKGRIRLGADADFCVFAPAESFVVDAAGLHHRNPVSPYDGQTLHGVVRSTWLRGVQLTDRATILDGPTGARHLMREP